MAEAKNETKTTAKASSAKATVKATDKKTTTQKTATKTATKTESKTVATKASTKTVAKKSKSDSEKKSHLVKIHHLKPAQGAHKDKTRVGRGEASKGKSAGRGTKGTHARNTVRIGFEGGQMPLHMRLPKLRGFKNPFKVTYQVVNLDRLEKVFPKGGKVTVEDLVLRGVVRNGHLVKLLSKGEVTQKFEITVDAYSAAAVKKIEAAGGVCNKPNTQEDK